MCGQGGLGEGAPYGRPPIPPRGGSAPSAQKAPCRGPASEGGGPGSELGAGGGEAREGEEGAEGDEDVEGGAERHDRLVHLEERPAQGSPLLSVSNSLSNSVGGVTDSSAMKSGLRNTLACSRMREGGG